MEWNGLPCIRNIIHTTCSSHHQARPGHWHSLKHWPGAGLSWCHTSVVCPGPYSQFPHSALPWLGQMRTLGTVPAWRSPSSATTRGWHWTWWSGSGDITGASPDSPGSCARSNVFIPMSVAPSAASDICRISLTAAGSRLSARASPSAFPNCLPENQEHF